MGRFADIADDVGVPRAIERVLLYGAVESDAGMG